MSLLFQITRRRVPWRFRVWSIKGGRARWLLWRWKFKSYGSFRRKMLHSSYTGAYWMILSFLFIQWIVYKNIALVIILGTLQRQRNINIGQLFYSCLQPTWLSKDWKLDRTEAVRHCFSLQWVMSKNWRSMWQWHIQNFQVYGGQSCSRLQPDKSVKI